jgi:hypothetical protein
MNDEWQRQTKKKKKGRGKKDTESISNKDKAPHLRVCPSMLEHIVAAARHHRVIQELFQTKLALLHGQRLCEHALSQLGFLCITSELQPNGQA